jgi:hypothetical protein
MDEKKKSKQDIAHALREAVHGTQEFLYLERDDAARTVEDRLQAVERELEHLDSSLHAASESTQVAVRESLGFLRGKHAEAMRRLRELQTSVGETAERAKQSLQSALSDLQHGVKKILEEDD